MKKIKWTLEESIVLVDAYVRNGQKIPIPANETARVSELLHRRAKKLGLDIDDKFRNNAGMNMQAACVHYVFTGGSEGLSNSNDMFYAAYHLYTHNRSKFYEALEAFYTLYGN
jgi:hypothetical protein